MATKVGIIGAGGMLQYHAAGFREANADIIAICDMNEVAAAKAAKEYEVANVFTDVAEMLEQQPDLEAVSVITPNRFHKPLSVQLLEAGKHVFCEKPPGKTGVLRLAGLHQGRRSRSHKFCASQMDSAYGHTRIWRLVYQ
jgi:predicted dehydrogenase